MEGYFKSGAFIVPEKQYITIKSTGEKIPFSEDLFYDADIRGSYTQASIIILAYNYGYRLDENHFEKGKWILDDLDRIMNLEYDQAKEEASTIFWDPYEYLIRDLEFYYEISEEAIGYLQDEIILPDGFYLGYDFSGNFGIFSEDIYEEITEEDEE